MTPVTTSGASGKTPIGSGKTAAGVRAPTQSATGRYVQKAVSIPKALVLAALALCFVCGGATLLLAQQKAAPAVVRLYTLDGGLTEFKDASIFSDTGEYDGKSIALPTPCYLLKHGNDWLLWDTGNGDRLATLPHGIERSGGRFTVRRTVKSQLAELGLTPDSIRFVALSHLHQDHTGNIGLFPNSTFLIDSVEYAWARRQPTPFGVDAATISLLLPAHVKQEVLDQDVFGDGSVRILKAPGHTPGSRMLLIKLAETGPVLISGDLYHTRENYEQVLVPSVNTSRANTLASSQRFKRLAANKHARAIIQHAPEDFAAMPAFPKYLR